MTNKQLVEKLEKAIEYYLTQMTVPSDFYEYYSGQIQAYRNVIKTIDPLYEDGGVGISLR